MKYFILKQEEVYKRNPRIREWYGKLDIHSLRMNMAESKEKFMFYIDVNEYTFFPDIMMNPTLMVTEPVKKIIYMYEKHIIFKEIYLLEPVSNKGYVYYIPILPATDCHVDTDTDSLHKRDKCCAVEESKVWDRHIMEAESEKGQCIIVSLDLAESMLRNGMTGIELMELQIYKNV